MEVGSRKISIQLLAVHEVFHSLESETTVVRSELTRNSQPQHHRDCLVIQLRAKHVELRARKVFLVDIVDSHYFFLCYVVLLL